MRANGLPPTRNGEEKAGMRTPGSIWQALDAAEKWTVHDDESEPDDTKNITLLRISWVKMNRLLLL